MVVGDLFGLLLALVLQLSNAKERGRTILRRDAGPDITVDHATEWLNSHKPAIVKEDTLSKGYVMMNAEEAVHTWKTAPWANDVPDSLFWENVLPYTHFDEKPEDWRRVLSQKLEPLVKNKKTLKDAANAVMQGIFTSFGEPAIKFKANSTPEVLSPLSDVLVKRYGSCSGLSIFVADGMRSVGIPARVVGIAEWNTPGKGNHNWVEVWFDNQWNYCDAGPGEKFNKAWFVAGGDVQRSVPGTLSGIYTPSWNAQKADGVYTITWRDHPFTTPALDLTERYAAMLDGTGNSRASGMWSGSWLLLGLLLLVIVTVSITSLWIKDVQVEKLPPSSTHIFHFKK